MRLYTRYRPQIDGPAATQDELQAIRNRNRAVKGDLLLSGVLMGAVFLYLPELIHRDVPVLWHDLLCLTAVIVAVALLFIADERGECYDSLKAIGDDDCVELAHLLAKTDSQSAIRYCSEVKKQGREFCKAELHALKTHLDASNTKSEISSARAFLYQQ